MTLIRKKYGLLIIGILAGIAYGVTTRIIFGEAGRMNSIAYLFVVPVVLGIIPLVFADEEQLKSYRSLIFIPWVTCGAFFLTLMLVKLEGFLCILILGAPFFMLGTLAAFIYRMVRLNKEKKKRLLTLAFLPFVFSFAEEFIVSPSALYQVKSEMIILAPPSTIWENIVEVPDIQHGEYVPGFFNRNGIPRPVSATVNRKEVGGRRTGLFAGGLKFDETITTYEEEKKISFRIHVDPATIGKSVFEQHVLNGNYFAFVDAAYELTPLPDGRTRLTLTSGYRLTSKINFYGKFWGDLVLEDFQERLLAVVKMRCEKKTGGNF